MFFHETFIWVKMLHFKGMLRLSNLGWKGHCMSFGSNPSGFGGSPKFCCKGVLWDNFSMNYSIYHFKASIIQISTSWESMGCVSCCVISGTSYVAPHPIGKEGEEFNSLQRIFQYCQVSCMWPWIKAVCKIYIFFSDGGATAGICTLNL